MFSIGDKVFRFRGRNAGMKPKDKGTIIDITETTYGTYLRLSEYRGWGLHEADCFKLIVTTNA